MPADGKWDLARLFKGLNKQKWRTEVVEVVSGSVTCSYCQAQSSTVV